MHLAIAKAVAFDKCDARVGESRQNEMGYDRCPVDSCSRKRPTKYPLTVVSELLRGCVFSREEHKSFH